MPDIEEKPPGRPPWAPGLHPAAWAFLGLIGLAGVSLVVSVVVAAWRLVDQASDLR